MARMTRWLAFYTHSTNPRLSQSPSPVSEVYTNPGGYSIGDHEEAANNRPLSLLAVASKVCEKIILNQFNTYLVGYKRLKCLQSGNKKAHSTETLNVQLTDSVLKAMDKKQITALVLLDLSKASDSIDHAGLLHKLSIVGASPSTVN